MPPSPPLWTRDASVAPSLGVAGEGTQVARDLMELEAERLAERDVALGVGGQHDTAPGQGCAISDSRPKSTLA